MEMEGIEQVVSSQQPINKYVKLKIVDDNLDVLEEFEEYLEMKVNRDMVNLRCIIEFKEKG